jgi:hypothetical protein
MPMALKSDADFISWILDDHEAGQDCRTKLGIVRTIELGGAKP